MAKHEIPKVDTTSVEMTTTVVDEGITETYEEVTTTVVEEPVTVIGVVSGCTKLNMRKTPETNAPIVSVLSESNEVQIDMEASTDIFYKVCAASGAEGFCMKKFITIRQ